MLEPRLEKRNSYSKLLNIPNIPTLQRPHMHSVAITKGVHASLSLHPVAILIAWIVSATTSRKERRTEPELETSVSRRCPLYA